MRLILIFLFLPILTQAQIYKVFQVKNQDTIQFKETTLRLPPVQNVIHCDYLVELDGVWQVNTMTIDIATKGIEIYGYSAKEDGKFHLIATTNDTDQVYQLGSCIQYILIRLLPGVWQSVNIDFSMQ